jgi:hypothetical protein
MYNRTNFRRAFVFVLLLGAPLHAQKPRGVVDLGVVQQIDRDKLPPVPLMEVKRQLGLTDVLLWDVQEVDHWLSDEGSVALLQQSFDGVEIDGTSMTVELDDNGDVVRINRAWLPEIAPTCDFGGDVAREQARTLWGVEELEPVYWPRLGGEMECAFRYQDEMFKQTV